MLAGVMAVDPVFKQTVSCHMQAKEYQKRQLCPQDFGALHSVQIALAVLSLFLVWLSAGALTKRYTVAWLAGLLAALAECYAYYTAEILTETLVFPLFSASVLFAIIGARSPKSWPWLLAGLFLGLSALTRPSFLYLFYAALPALALWGALRQDKERRGLKKLTAGRFVSGWFCR